MEMNFATISAWIGMFLWPFFRIGAAMLSMPFYGDGAIPVWVRTLLALSVTVISAPLMPTMSPVDLISLTMVGLIVEQIIWGVFFGLMLHLLFAIFTMLGQIISLQMGLAMAVMNDPVNGQSVAILGRIFQILCFLLFLALDGHLVILDILVQSFFVWPVGSGLPLSSLQGIIQMGGWMLTSSLALALPAIVSMLLANIGFGVMNRAAPSLNIYALGFPMTMLLGLFSVLISVSNISVRYTELVHTGLTQLNLYTTGTR